MIGVRCVTYMHYGEWGKGIVGLKFHGNNKSQHRLKRAFAVLLSFSLGIQLFAPGKLGVLETQASSSATGTSHLVQDDVYVEIQKTLEDYDNRMYQLTVDASSYLKQEYIPYTQAYSKDDTFIAEEDGYYLVEIWGGSGGSGVESISGDDGGIGGQGGYVYACLYMTAGQSLVFTIGTNGGQRAENGANEGGIQASGSMYSAGAGGGYTAVFFFDSAKSTYSLTEQERLSNYILIAGGGGGGGAPSTMLYSGYYVNPPDGGSGGNMTSSKSGHLSANDNNGVAGTYYVGTNGRSSGTSTKYIGYGGTSVPGQMATSWDGYTGVIRPNDWTGTYNDEWYESHPDYAEKNTQPGGGGMGASHGGSGGAGFTGGSGGFQSALLVPTNIGGGGGGSSFVADETITGTPLTTNLTEDVASYLYGTNPSDIGGACEITFLGAGKAESTPETVDTSHMADVVLSGTISKYFDVISATVLDHNGTVETAVTSAGTTAVTVTGVNIQPDELGFEDHTVTLQIMVRAKEDFAGGNMVPVISGQFKITPVGHDAITAKSITSTDYCNVALDFSASACSYMSNEPGKTYAASDLYVDNYTTARSNCGSSSYYQWEYLSSISLYTVKQSGSSTAVTSVSPTTTTSYVVSFTVTPSSTTGAAVGATIKTTTYSATATITIVEADMADTLNGLQIDGTKLLSYSDGKYSFEVNVNQKSETVFVMDNTVTFNTAGTGSYEVKESGWYYIQLWGGNGGSSGTAAVYQRLSGQSVGSGASGGTGGYITAFMYLTEGELISYQVGKAGSSSSGSSVTLSNYSDYKARSTSGGGGGTYTSFTLGDSLLLIAGGGGGAGGAGAAARGSGVGKSASGVAGKSVSANYSSTLSGSLDSYSGGSGTAGSASVSPGAFASISASSGSAGSAGSNYQADRYDAEVAMANGMSDAAFVYMQSITSKKSGSGGQLTLTLLETEESASVMTSLYDLASSGTISRYFDIEDVGMTTTSDTNATSRTENEDGSVTVTYKYIGTEVAHFTYALSENADGTTSYRIYDTYYSPRTTMTARTLEDGVTSGYDIQYQSALTFTLTLSPREGFLGGNDVPLVAYGSSGDEDTGVAVSQKEESRWFNKRDSVDFANVDVACRLDESNLDTQNITILCGESVSQSEQLLTVNEVSLPEGDEGWKSEFVEVIYPETAVVAPTATTTYSFTTSVAAKDNPKKAVVKDGALPVSFTKTAIVTVDYTVTLELEHLQYEGDLTVASGSNLSATISADSGYRLPASITVTVGGSTLSTSNYTYSRTTGELSIGSGKMTGNIVITGAATVVTYDIYYIYEDISENRYEEQEETSFAADALLTLSDLKKYAQINESLTEVEGYTFRWDWQTEDGEPVTKMPSEDLYVYGSYEPNLYHLTVHYVYRDEEGNTAAVAPDENQDVYYGREYTIVSPNVPGYLAKTTVLTGTMAARDTEITVEYRKTTGYLSVVYLYADTSLTIENEIDATIIDGVYQEAIREGDTYEVVSPDIAGYSPDVPVVSGTVSGTDADEGIIVYVYYQPNQYTITFDPDGGTLDESERSKTVAYHNIYGYDPTKAEGERYEALPQPIYTGYEFLGWYTEDGTLIEEESIVSCREDHTLTAKWSPISYRLTIRYTYTDSSGNELGEEEFPSGAQASYANNYTLGEEYSIPIADYEGFTHDQGEENAIAGTMGAGNKVFFITYKRWRYTVTFHLTDDEGQPLSTSSSAYYTTTKTFYYDYGSSDTLGYTTTDSSSHNVSGLAYNSTSINSYCYVPRAFVQIKEIGTENEEIYTTSGSSGDTNRDQINTLYSTTAYTTCGIDYKTYLAIHPDEDITRDGFQIDVNIRCGARYYYSITYTVSGTDGAGYKPDTPEAVRKPYYYYQSITVVSPAIDDEWTPSAASIKPSTSSTGNKSSTVTYSVNKYTLTIHYQYADNVTDESLRDTIYQTNTYSLAYNTEYRYDSPEIEGYYTRTEAVAGTLTTDREVTVLYTDQTDAVSVTIEWDAMNFDLTGIQWDEKEHSYAGGTYTPKPEGGNAIRITNSGIEDVVVSYLYGANEEYSQMTGYFTETGVSSADSAESQTLPASESMTIWLWLKGKYELAELPQSGETISFTPGTCSIIIGKGDSSQ